MILKSLLAGRPGVGPILAVLLIAGAVMTSGAVLRGTEYDEDYTIFLAAGNPRPVWPEQPFTAGSVRHFFAGHSTAASIARNLRATDVHPPLYFWAAAAWRGTFGTSLLVTRLASVVFSLAALLCVGTLAAMTGVPPVAAMLLTAGCYGFAYTGLVARGFALAQLLSLGGICLLVLAARRAQAGWVIALGGGVLLGLASFTNYLTVFGAAVGLLWLLLQAPRRPAVWLAAGSGFAVLLPADLWFFLAQRGSRVGQFPPFELREALVRLGEYHVANVFGGLPLYVTDGLRLVVGGVVVGALAVVAGVIAWRFRALNRPARRLFVFGIAAQAIGLVALGFVFNNIPVELRYIAFSMPFFGLLTAAAIASLAPRRRLQGLLLGMILGVQAASLVGMVTRPETMQPQRAVARAAAAAADDDTVVLLPRGNDGVGVVAAFVAESPDRLRLLLVDSARPAGDLLAAAGGFRRAVLAELALDADSRAELAMAREALAAAPCWRPQERTADIAVYRNACADGAQAERGQK